MCGVAVILGLSLTTGHPKWHDCDADYWKERCGLKRGYKGYTNFLAVMTDTHWLPKRVISSSCTEIRTGDEHLCHISRI